MCSSSAEGGDSMEDDDDMTGDMEIEQFHNDSAYDSFTSQSK